MKCCVCVCVCVSVCVCYFMLINMKKLFSKLFTSTEVVLKYKFSRRRIAKRPEVVTSLDNKPK